MTDQKSSETTEERRQKPRRCCGLSLKDGLNFLSSLILPSMLGVFTVIITFQQQKIAQQQRTEDLQVTRQQRTEDLQVTGNSTTTSRRSQRITITTRIRMEYFPRSPSSTE